jgi:hypothetical protein
VKSTLGRFRISTRATASRSSNTNVRMLMDEGSAATALLVTETWVRRVERRDAVRVALPTRRAGTTRVERSSATNPRSAATHALAFIDLGVLTPRQTSA